MIELHIYKDKLIFKDTDSNYVMDFLNYDDFKISNKVYNFTKGKKVKKVYHN